MKNAVIILGILLLVCLICIGWQYEQIRGLNDNRFFDYEYRPISNSIVTKWKRDGNVESVGFDLNEDLELDSVVVYGKDEHIVSIWVDRDFNGIYEIEYLYSRKEDVIARYDDHTQNGLFHHFTRYTADSIFSYEDVNEDGWFEESELYSSQLRGQ